MASKALLGVLAQVVQDQCHSDEDDGHLRRQWFRFQVCVNPKLASA